MRDILLIVGAALTNLLFVVAVTVLVQSGALAAPDQTWAWWVVRAGALCIGPAVVVLVLRSEAERTP